MRAYDFILARESLTYSLLKKAGLENIDLIPDTAFSLPIEKLPLPEGFIEGNTIGINLSPLAVEKEEKPGIVLENYKCLIRWILENSDSAIALIPHVVWKENDDRTVLGELYKIFKETKRVVMIQDCNCMQLKGYISRCRFFIGARTHATIAAYSTGVPTLVVGYSIKSRGIATDLFGTDQGYVVSVQSMKKENDLLGAFVKLYGKEREITSILKTIMPEYIGKIRKIMPQIESVLRRTK